MNSPKDVVHFYLKRIEETIHPVEKEIVKSDLRLYYYRLTEAEAESVSTLMQPIIQEMEAKLIEQDSLLKRAHDLLGRLQNRAAYS